jgi:hypothetical protein
MKLVTKENPLLEERVKSDLNRKFRITVPDILAGGAKASADNATLSMLSVRCCNALFVDV